MSGSLTHGFLFADLRGYTAYVDREGAAAAAGILARYRALVRAGVAAHDGAEIRTEGDSFYVVFPSASGAVACALEIVAAAGRASLGGEPIAVGVGVHAGEAVETPEGPVGTAVNIAARLCALAKPGEVVVSDTVRALTRSVASAAFVPIGRRRLKGLDEPMALYRAVPAGTPVRTPARARAANRLVAGGALVAAVVAIALVAAALLRAGGPTGAAGSPSAGSSATSGGPASGTASGGPASEPPTGAPTPSASRRPLGYYDATDFALPFEIFLGTDWTRSRQQADLVVFNHPGDPAGWLDVLIVAAVMEPPCESSTPQFSIGDRPADLIDWLTTRTWLEHRDPRPYNVGPYIGRAVEIEVLPGDTWQCEGRPGGEVATFFRLGGGPAGDRFWGADVGERKLVVALDVDGRRVALIMGSPFEDVEQLWREETAHLQSIRFLDR